MTTKTSDEEPSSTHLPEWAKDLRRRYLSGQATLFLLHGNVHDLMPAPDNPDFYVPLREFLLRFVSRAKEVVGFYNQSEGLTFPEPEMKESFIRTINASRLLKRKSEISAELPVNPSQALELMEEYLILPQTRGAMIIDFVETIVPDGTVAFMGSEDRDNLVTLQRWATDPRMISSDNLVILITENLSDVHRRVVTTPQMAALDVCLPDESQRLQFLKNLAQRYKQTHPSPKRLAPVTAGLSRIQMEGIYRQAWQSQSKVSEELVRQRKQEIIEQECFGLVEFVHSNHDFSKVGGMDHVKKVLSRVAEAIKEGQTRRVPMGALFVGPMGTGKTFLAEAFSKESGLTCLKLKNFRDKWVGSTEANLEKILNVIRAMGYVLVIIDEGDRSIGGQTGDSDGGTSSRVIARLKEFMSDTSHRGRIIFLMMTNRPDKLDADMKRSGRFDLKIPFFFPQTPDERELIFRALLKKNAIEHGIKDLGPAVQATKGYSGAEIEAILLLALGLALDDGRKRVREGDLMAAVEDFIPSRDMAMVDYMELLAVFECSSRRMLPTKYQQMTTEELNQRLREMRRGLL